MENNNEDEYILGWYDGYNNRPYNNSYDKNTEQYKQYSMGYIDGLEDGN